MSHKYYAPKKMTASEHEAMIARSAKLIEDLKREMERMRFLIEQRSQLNG